MQFWCVKSLARNSGRVKLLTNLMSALPPLIWKEIHFFLRIASPIHPQCLLAEKIPQVFVILPHLYYRGLLSPAS